MQSGTNVLNSRPAGKYKVALQLIVLIAVSIRPGSLDEQANALVVSLKKSNGTSKSNLIENSIRPVALGRKNYLFAGSRAGAERAAMVYNLPGSCKLPGINPNDSLPEVLQRLPEQPVNRLTELLPPL